MIKKLILISAIAISGCSTQQIKVSNKAANINDRQSMELFFVGGIGQSRDRDPFKDCGFGKVAMVETSYQAVDILIPTLSFMTVTPSHSNVFCKKLNR